MNAFHHLFEIALSTLSCENVKTLAVAQVYVRQRARMEPKESERDEEWQDTAGPLSLAFPRPEQ